MHHLPKLKGSSSSPSACGAGAKFVNGCHFLLRAAPWALPGLVDNPRAAIGELRKAAEPPAPKMAASTSSTGPDCGAAMGEDLKRFGFAEGRLVLRGGKEESVGVRLGMHR